MPALAPIATHDGVAAHSFAPEGPNKDGAQSFVERTGTPITDRRLAVSRSRGPTGRELMTVKLTIPVGVTATVDGVAETRVLRTGFADVKFSFEKNSTPAERKALIAMVTGLFNEETDILVDMAATLEHLY